MAISNELLESLGYIPPAEAEAQYYQQLERQAGQAVWLNLNSLHNTRGCSLQTCRCDAH